MRQAGWTGWSMAVVAGCVLGVMVSWPSTALTEEPAMPRTVGNNMDIGLEYALTVDGEVVDSTDGRDTFHYVHGQGQIVKGLERQLAGMKVGDQKEVIVTPEDGYGTVDPEAFVEVSNAQLPTEMTPAVGMVLRAVGPEGTNVRAIIHELKDKSVVLNLNHPLAGKTLTFQVTVATISPAALQ